MRKTLITFGAMAAMTATPALAYDSGDLISMQQALAVATNLGLVTVSDTEFSGHEWEIEGRDFSGRYMEVDVDARTGEVRNLDR